MSSDYDDTDYYYDPIPEGYRVCDRCNGDGVTLDPYNFYEECTCPVCWGEGIITLEKAERRAKAHAEMAEVLRKALA